MFSAVARATPVESEAKTTKMYNLVLRPGLQKHQDGNKQDKKHRDITDLPLDCKCVRANK